MNKEQIYNTIELIREHNEDLHKKLRIANKVIKGKSKKRTSLEIEQIQEILILVSILLSANIKVRYDLDQFIEENKAFVNITMIKNLANNCKADIEALKSISFNMTSILQTMKLKEEEKRYKEESL